MLTAEYDREMDIAVNRREAMIEILFKYFNYHIFK